MAARASPKANPCDRGATPPHGLAGQGLLSNATSLADLDRIEFPDARYLDFSATLARLDAAGPYYRLGGMWAPFFHNLCYLFGTEELLCLILEAPDPVKTTTERICTFYLEANDRLYALAAARDESLLAIRRAGASSTPTTKNSSTSGKSSS